MGPVSTPALAVAVAQAGGVGSITAQWLPAAELDTLLGDMAKQTAGLLAYKQAVADAAAGSTEITGAFSICPLCATVPRARVLRSCIDAMQSLADETVGEMTVGGESISLPKGHGLPQSAAATGRIDAMPLYAGESAAAFPAVESVAQVIESWCAAAGEAR